MRHDPVGVDGVPGETAGQLVVDAAAGHRLAGQPDLLQRLGRAGSAMVAQQELQHHRGRELRRRAVAAVGPVELLAEPGRRLVEHVGPQRPRLAGGQRGLQRPHDPATGLEHLVPPLGPGLGGGRQQPQEAVPGKVGAAEERLAGRGQQAGHRPAAMAGHRRGRRHVDRVDVGPLLAVDLDRDEPLVQDRRHLGVLEGLVRHHVAPVAGGVADAQQHRHVAPAGLVEGLGAPWPPVHRIVGMLGQVRACRVREPVCHEPNLSAPRPSRSPPERRHRGGRTCRARRVDEPPGRREDGDPPCQPARSRTTTPATASKEGHSRWQTPTRSEQSASTTSTTTATAPRASTTSGRRAAGAAT